jgi:ketosteroid isomerase-like protein
MSTSTSTSPAVSETEQVRRGFAAAAAGDLAAFAAGFHPDATWNHRNPDRLGGVKQGIDGIVAFLADSMTLTGGTLGIAPERFLPDGDGHVAVLTRITGRRPDGRHLDDPQVLVFRLEEGLVRAVDQFVGDPDAVTAFWA